MVGKSRYRYQFICLPMEKKIKVIKSGNPNES